MLILEQKATLDKNGYIMYYNILLFPLWASFSPHFRLVSYYMYILEK